MGVAKRHRFRRPRLGPLFMHWANQTSVYHGLTLNSLGRPENPGQGRYPPYPPLPRQSKLSDVTQYSRAWPPTVKKKHCQKNKKTEMTWPKNLVPADSGQRRVQAAAHGLTAEEDKSGAQNEKMIRHCELFFHFAPATITVVEEVRLISPLLAVRA